MEILEGELEGDLDRIHWGREREREREKTLQLVVYEVCLFLRKLHVLAMVG